jgi:hypothetical protein
MFHVLLWYLTGVNCVGGMGRDQFYHWMADYLHFLWYQEEDPILPKQALPVLASLFQLYDAELALLVLLSRPLHKAHTGGKGVSLAEILTFFQPLFPMIHPYHVDLWCYGSTNQPMIQGNNAFTFSYQKDLILEKSLKKVIASVPLFNGLAIGIVYLECLISLPDAMPQMYDEYVEYLFTGIQDLLTGNISGGAGGGENSPARARDTTMILPVHFTLPFHGLAIQPKDSPVIKQYKIYRSKLQSFLQQPSIPYHPQLLLRLLPPDFQYEYALVLSKLGKHLDVLYLCIYVLASIPLAELYCECIYKVMVTGQKDPGLLPSSTNGKGTSFSGIPPLHVTTTTTTSASSIAKSDPTLNTVRFPINIIGLFRPGDAYLLLFQVILEDKAGKSTPEERISRMLSLAEKHFDKFNTNAFLSLLPSSVTLANLLPYLLKVLEFQHTKKRNLQVIERVYLIDVLLTGLLIVYRLLINCYGNEK